MRAVLVVLAMLAAVLLGGCGLGAGDDQPGGVTLTVSRDFGDRELGRAKRDSVPGGETVMRLLERSFDVKTRYGGGFVQQINGVAGGRLAGRPVDWFYYVNGVEVGVGAAQRRINPGDRVWWDHHDWGDAARIPAVVGSFPEPFLSGVDGRRLPVRIDCARGEDAACDEVRKRLEVADVTKVSRGLPGGSAGKGVLRIVVGPWPAIRADPALQPIERGPAASGVYARMDRTGRRIALLEPDGTVARTLAGGAGLLAATRLGDQQPTWVVTGTNKVGVAAAAGQLDETALHERFAIAVVGGRPESLPVPSPSEGP